jgi:hypothetical protein
MPTQLFAKDSAMEAKRVATYGREHRLEVCPRARIDCASKC